MGRSRRLPPLTRPPADPDDDFLTPEQRAVQRAHHTTLRWMKLDVLRWYEDKNERRDTLGRPPEENYIISYYGHRTAKENVARWEAKVWEFERLKRDAKIRRRNELAEQVGTQWERTGRQDTLRDSVQRELDRLERELTEDYLFDPGPHKQAVLELSAAGRDVSPVKGRDFYWDSRFYEGRDKIRCKLCRKGCGVTSRGVWSCTGRGCFNFTEDGDYGPEEPGDENENIWSDYPDQVGPMRHIYPWHKNPPHDMIPPPDYSAGAPVCNLHSDTPPPPARHPYLIPAAWKDRFIQLPGNELRCKSCQSTAYISRNGNVTCTGLCRWNNIRQGKPGTYPAHRNWDTQQLDFIVSDGADPDGSVWFQKLDPLPRIPWYPDDVDALSDGEDEQMVLQRMGSPKIRLHGTFCSPCPVCQEPCARFKMREYEDQFLDMHVCRAGHGWS